MKRKVVSLLLAAIMLISLLPITALAADSVTATVAGFKVTLNGQEIANDNATYPLLVYKDITYFPLTFNHCKLLGVASDWNAKTGLTLTTTGVAGTFEPYTSDKTNPESVTASVIDYAVTINGKAIDNTTAEYPLLSYNDVTYFPLTWDYCVDDFGWEYDYSDAKGLVINLAGTAAKEEEKEETTTVVEKKADPTFSANALTTTAITSFVEESFNGLNYYLYVPGGEDFLESGPSAAGLALVLMDDDILCQTAYEFAKASTQQMGLTIVVAVKKPAGGYNLEAIRNLVGEMRGRFTITETKLYCVGEGDGATAAIELQKLLPSAFAALAVDADTVDLSGPWLETKPILCGDDYVPVNVPKFCLPQIMDRTINWTKKHPDYITVTASSNQADATLATDKNYGGATAWKATDSGASWIMIDFQEEDGLIATRWGVKGVEACSNYTIEYSMDGKTWTVLDKVENYTHANVDRFVKRTVGRYFRLSSTEAMNITEFEVYGDHITFDKFSYETFESKTVSGASLAYRQFTPTNVKSGEKVPLVVYLHGAGQRGYFNEAQLSITCGEGATNFAYDSVQEKNPCYIIAIQCPLEQQFSDDRTSAMVAELIKEMLAKYDNIDADRVYLTGLSLGGLGTYRIATDYPELFAALVPLAGGGWGDVLTNAYKIKDMPIWAFHSNDDNMVNISIGQAMIDALVEAGAVLDEDCSGDGNLRWTVYPDGTFGLTPHYCWLYVYYDQDMFDWLFQQSRKNWAN